MEVAELVSGWHGMASEGASCLAYLSTVKVSYLASLQTLLTALTHETWRVPTYTCVYQFSSGVEYLLSQMGAEMGVLVPLLSPSFTKT